VFDVGFLGKRRRGDGGKCVNGREGEKTANKDNFVYAKKSACIGREILVQIDSLILISLAEKHRPGPGIAPPPESPMMLKVSTWML
jgi:hypothetical protein